MSGPRNPWGFKDMADLYRTVKGERYEWLELAPTPQRLAAYRQAGVRCRRFQIDGNPELFIHPDDITTADQAEASLSTDKRGSGE